MQATFWIFKDPASGEVRITATDPGPTLSQLDRPPRESPAGPFPDGVLLSTVLGQLTPLMKAMRGTQGDEAYVKVTLGDPA